MKRKDFIAILSFAVTSYLWITISYYVAGSVPGYWYDTSVPFILPVLTGEYILALYTFLMWKFYFIDKRRKLFAAMMTIIWSLWMFSATFLLIHPVIPSGSGLAHYPAIYIMLWGGEVSGIAIGIFLYNGWRTGQRIG